VKRPPSPLRSLLVALLIVILVAIYAVTRRGTPTTARVAEAFNQATVPVSATLSRLSAFVARDVQYVQGLRSAEHQIARLQNELAQTNLALTRERAAVAEDQTLRSLLHLRQDLKAPTVAAEVVGLSPATWWESVNIDRGALDGVTAGAPVLAPSGLVGRVLLVSPHVATVMLLANGQSGVGVKDVRSGALGVALGDSVAQKLTVDFFSPTASVKVGDKLVTSGLGGSFPAGLPVASVLSVSQGQTGLISAAAQPTVDPATVTDVLVLESSAS
jgi:rod shape-determining protein MreC